MNARKLVKLWFESLPDPAGQIFAGGVLQTCYVIEIMMIQLLEQGFEGELYVGKIQHPAAVLSNGASHDDAHLKRMPMQAGTLVSIWHIGQPMGGFDTEFLENFHVYEVVTATT